MIDCVELVELGKEGKVLTISLCQVSIQLLYQFYEIGIVRVGSYGSNHGDAG